MVVVALSRRNLQSLLAKLDGHPPGSAKTLTYDNGDGVILMVTVEEDAEHYVNPERDTQIPGPLDVDTDGAIRSAEWGCAVSPSQSSRKQGPTGTRASG